LQKMRGERIQINEKLLQYTVYKGSVSKLCLFSDVFINRFYILFTNSLLYCPDRNNVIF
jgi:hypothetical protein